MTDEKEATSTPVQDIDTASFEKSSVHEDPKSTETSSTTVNEPSKGAEKVEDAPEKKEEAEDTSNYPTGFKLVTLIIALCLAVFLVALDQTIIATAIPKITDHFNSISDIGWYGSAYFLTATSLQPTFGRVYKVFSVCLSLPNTIYCYVSMIPESF